MRQDPDVILVGEVRDSELAKMVLTAASTGHLVLTSVHAANCIETITRFEHLGIHPEALVNKTRLFVSQRLLPANCQNCCQDQTPTNDLASIFGLSRGAKIKISTGCEHCSGTGIRGRIALFETLKPTESLKESISQNGYRENEVRKIAVSQNYKPIILGIRQSLIRGLISQQVALRAVGLDYSLF